MGNWSVKPEYRTQRYAVFEGSHVIATGMSQDNAEEIVRAHNEAERLREKLNDCGCPFRVQASRVNLHMRTCSVRQAVERLGHGIERISTQMTRLQRT